MNLIYLGLLTSLESILKMKVKFFQQEWFGESLAHHRDKLNLPKGALASSEIYTSIYESLLDHNFRNISEEWISKKLTLIPLISDIINQEKIDPKILSIGCGLGIIEHELIKLGFSVDMQECQDISTKYVFERFPNDFIGHKFYNSFDLSDISDNQYSVIISVTSTYCLSDDVLKIFLSKVNNLLTKDGIFIWYETVLTAQDLYSYFRQLFSARDEDVFWGWKRSVGDFYNRMSANGFALKEHLYLDALNCPTHPKFILGIPYSNTPTWQMMVFQKND